MLQTCSKNLFSEQIYEVRSYFSSIFKSVVYGKLDLNYKKVASALKDFEQIVYSKSAEQAKKYV